MYDELWTGAKAMYKLEPAVAVGGEVVIYAPHLDTVSLVHGQHIYDVGTTSFPISSTTGAIQARPARRAGAQHAPARLGVMEGNVERANVRVTLASRISPEDCARLNVGYLDPAKVDLEAWKNREKEGILFVPKAGEMLYRVRQRELT